MGIAGHVATSAVVLGVVFAVTNSLAFALSAAGGSLLLDIDHLFDYWLIDHQHSLNPVRFLKYYSRSLPRRRLLLLHSYEVLAVLVAFALLTAEKAVGGFVAGAFIHLGADVLPRSNYRLWQRVKLYSLAYRWHHGFNSNRLYR